MTNVVDTLKALHAEHATLMGEQPKGSDIYGQRETRLAAIRSEIAKLEAEQAAAAIILDGNVPAHVARVRQVQRARQAERDSCSERGSWAHLTDGQGS